MLSFHKVAKVAESLTFGGKAVRRSRLASGAGVGVLASFPGLHAQLFCRFRTASVDHELGVEARERG